ncbi:hypothetical protein HK101_000454 [Irineochytrium annulatum]|nr:hypothetical protein HK101_000454 [Irineochytrium annulatum]
MLSRRWTNLRRIITVLPTASWPSAIQAHVRFSSRSKSRPPPPTIGVPFVRPRISTTWSRPDNWPRIPSPSKLPSCLFRPSPPPPAVHPLVEALRRSLATHWQTSTEAFSRLLAEIQADKTTRGDLTIADLRGAMRWLSHRANKGGDIHDDVAVVQELAKRNEDIHGDAAIVYELLKEKDVDPRAVEFSIHLLRFKFGVRPSEVKRVRRLFDTVERVDGIKPIKDNFFTVMRLFALRGNVESTLSMVEFMREQVSNVDTDAEVEHWVMTSYVRSKASVRALNYLKNLRRRAASDSSFKINVDSYNTILGGLVSDRMDVLVRQFFLDMIADPTVQPNLDTMIIMLGYLLLPESGETPEIGLAIADAIMSAHGPNSPPARFYETLIDGLFLRELPTEALRALDDALRRRVQPTPRLLNMVLKHSHRLGLAAHVRQVYNTLLPPADSDAAATNGANGRPPRTNLISYRRLLTMHVDRGEVGPATEVFTSLLLSKFVAEEEDYLIMIKGFARAGDWDAVERYNGAMRAAGGSSTGEAEKEVVWIVTYHAAGRREFGLARKKLMEYAGMVEPGARVEELAGVVLQAMVDAGEAAGAEALVEEMMAKGLMKKPPEEYILHVAAGLRARDDVAGLERLMTWSRDRGTTPSLFLHTELVRLLAADSSHPDRRQRVQRAVWTMTNTDKHEIPTWTFFWNQLLELYYDDPAETERVLDDMRGRGVKFDAMTYKALMSHAVKRRKSFELMWALWTEYSGRVKAGWIVERPMLSSRGWRRWVKPEPERLNADIARMALRGCIVHNRPDEAMKVWAACEDGGINIMEGAEETYLRLYGEAIEMVGKGKVGNGVYFQQEPAQVEDPWRAMLDEVGHFAMTAKADKGNTETR